MSRQNLRLQVLLSAVDNLTRPLRNIRHGSSNTAKALKSAQQRVKELNQQAGQIEGYRRLARDVGITGNQLKTAQDRVRALAIAMQNTAAPTAAMRREFERAQQETQRLKQRQNQLSQAQQRSRTALRSAGIDTRNLSQHQRQLRQNLDTANRSLEQQRMRLERLNRQQQKMNKAKASYAGAMDARNKLAGFGAISTATGAGIAYGGSRLMMPGYEFDAGMSRVQALTRTDKNSPELKRLRNQARELGASTSFTANDVAGGQGYLAMAGYTPDKIEKAMPSMLNLAKAAGMDSQLAEVADIASNIQSAYKIPAEQMQRMADSLTYTFTTSNTDLRMLGETMKYVGPAAQAAGQQFETMAAMTGMLGNVGIQGSQAGTSLRMALVRLAKQPKAAKKALTQLGVSVADSTGRMKQLPQLLSDISASFKKLGIDGVGNAKKLALISHIFGVEATSALAELLDKQASLDPSQRIEAYADQVKASLGIASKVAKTMADNMKGDVQGLQSAWQDVGIEMFESVDSPLRGITQRITGVIRSVGEWMKKNPQLTATLVSIAAGVAVVAVTLGTLSLVLAAILGPLAVLKLSLSVLGIKGGSVLTLLGSAFKKMGGVVIWLGRLMLANPLLAVLALIASAAAWIWQNWDWLGPKFAALWDGIKNFASNTLTAVKNYLSNWRLGETFNRVWNELLTAFSNLPARFMEIGGNIMEGLKQGILNKWNDVKQGVLDLGDSMSGWFKEKLGIRSPSRVFAQMGRYTVEGLAVGIEQNTRTALASVGKLSKRLTSAGAGLALSAAVAFPAISAQPDNRVPLSSAGYSIPAAQSAPITIHILAAPGMDEQQLARLVAQELDKRERQTAARYRSSLRDIE